MSQKEKGLLEDDIALQIYIFLVVKIKFLFNHISYSIVIMSDEDSSMLSKGYFCLSVQFHK